MAKNIGIKAIQVYFPQSYILQADLEERDIEILGEENRSKIKGKYTNGLCQHALSFCSDHEDTVSIAMNAVKLLMEENGYKCSDFGRLEVGTESSVDRSKSIKSFLMQMFSSNKTMMGVDNQNACYGGTAALLNSIAWIESSFWDGRLALVVAADIAVYDQMAARPTGGCGAVAMVIGPDAPIVFEHDMCAHYFSHAFDFYKPNPVNPHPLVDGHLSLQLYYECLDNCFIQLRKKHNGLSVDNFDYVCFHTPFINHVKKCTGRLLFLKEHPDDNSPEIESSRKDGKVVSTWSQQASEIFEQKVKPSLTLSSNCGNGYTASLYLAIASLINNKDLDGKRILCFSYGSGCASSIFSLKVVGSTSNIQKHLNLDERLSKRRKRTVLEYEEAVAKADKLYRTAPYTPSDSLDLVGTGCWYLECVNEAWRRTYALKN